MDRLPDLARWALIWLSAAVPLPRGAGGVQAEDWPAWRGPRGDGTSRHTHVPLRWDGPTGQNIAWKTLIPGQGHGSPVVWNDRIFLATCLVDSQQRVLMCLDRRTGQILWRRTVVTAPLETKHARNSYASSTPAVDGQRVYIAFLETQTDTVSAPNVSTPRRVNTGTVVVAAYDLEGQPVWHARVGGFVSVHGFCSNPVLFEGLVIVNGDHDGDSYLVALDKESGRTVWKVPRAHRTRSYATPIVRHVAGRTQLVLPGSHAVTSYDPRDGSVIWTLDGPTEQFVASPVFDGQHFLVVAGFPTYHVLAIHPDGRGNVTQTHVAWHVTNARGYVPSPVVIGPYLVVADDRGTVAGFEPATGRRLWQIRLGRQFSASLVAAGGLAYCLAEDGVTHVLRPGEQPQRIADNPLGEPCYASPAITHGQIFIRSERHLWCVGTPSERRAEAARSVP